MRRVEGAGGGAVYGGPGRDEVGVPEGVPIEFHALGGMDFGEKSDGQGSPLPPGEKEVLTLPTPGREVGGQFAPLPLGGRGVTETFGNFGWRVGLGRLFSGSG